MMKYSHLSISEIRYSKHLIMLDNFAALYFKIYIIIFSRDDFNFSDKIFIHSINEKNT